MVQKNDRFSELSADRVFSLQNRLLAVRNTRFEKQSSIYSRQMSKLHFLCFVRTASTVWLSFAEKEFEPEFDIALSEDLFDRPFF
jgi:hypothetical protein